MKALRIGICLLLVPVIAASGLGCGRRGDGDNPRKRGARGPRTKGPGGANGGMKREYAVPVGVIELERRTMSEYVTTVGTVAPARSLAVKAEESGRIEFIKRWRKGDYVKKGEIIAYLDEEDAQRELEMSRADLARAQSQVELSLARRKRSEADFERAKLMLELGQISQKAYEERQFNFRSATISYDEGVLSLKKTEKSLERLKTRMERKIVIAPMSGRLITRSAVESRNMTSTVESADAITDLEGQLIGSGNTVCGVVDTSSILVRCDVTSKDIAKIKAGMTAEAHVYSDREIQVEGKVIDVSPIMDMQTHAFKVDVAASNEEARFRPGMFARVNIIIKTHRDALVVDRKVLQRRNNENVLFVVDDEDRAEKRIVALGLENPDEVEVIDELREGERLVVLGHETLQDKVLVKIVDTDKTVAQDGATSPTKEEDGTTSSTRVRSATKPSPKDSVKPGSRRPSGPRRGRPARGGGS